MDKVDVRFPSPKPAAPPPALPKTALERATALSGLMRRLAAHLDRESAAVRGRLPPAEILRMARDKQPMVLVYEEVSRLLRVDREGLAGLPPEVKRELAEATRQLAASAAANTETLKINSDAQQMMVDTLVGAVNRARQSQPGVAYGPGAGGFRQPPRGYGPPKHGPATSATLNTHL